MNSSCCLAIAGIHIKWNSTKFVHAAHLIVSLSLTTGHADRHPHCCIMMTQPLCLLLLSLGQCSHLPRYLLVLPRKSSHPRRWKLDSVLRRSLPASLSFLLLALSETREYIYVKDMYIPVQNYSYIFHTTGTFYTYACQTFSALLNFSSPTDTSSQEKGSRFAIM